MKLWAVRYELRAIDAVRFPPGKAGNVFRGALGLMLQRVAGREEGARLFEPHRSDGPSGLADPPRPFVLRVAHLDGRTLGPGRRFAIRLHLFDTNNPAVDVWTRAMEGIAAEGIGPGRGRCALERSTPQRIELSLAAVNADRIRVLFLTPTELKAGGVLARPEMQVLFARARDRVAMLGSLYGGATPDIDFHALGEMARQVRVTAEDLRYHDVERSSGRTGQTHPLGGFTGWVDYEGPLGALVPYLEAAAWTGVGRQTVWGKGQIAVERPKAPAV
jgi:hypothetical protein